MSKDIKLSGQPVICQLLSFIPHHIIQEAVSQTGADYYYKKMTTYNQLVFILYGVVSKIKSLNNLCKCLGFLDDKLVYLGINQLPASSTLSDSNRKRSSEVFATIYYLLYEYYRPFLSDSYIKLFINGEIDPAKVRIFDSTTISLFTDLFKGAGRSPINGKRKGGLKLHTVMSLDNCVPDILWMSSAATNDRVFLGQLPPTKDLVYVFDKGYVNYQIYKSWTESGAFYVTRLNENATYQVQESKPGNIEDINSGGVIKDEIILLPMKGNQTMKARLITYRDPVKKELLYFVSNMFECHAMTIVQLYKNRWSIEVLFKQIKQNFELSYFYCVGEEGIKTQVWIALIANLIFTVIHKQLKECEQFTTIVAMVAVNQGSYVCFMSLIKEKRRSRNIEKIQLPLFEKAMGGVFQNSE